MTVWSEIMFLLYGKRLTYNMLKGKCLWVILFCIIFSCSTDISYAFNFGKFFDVSGYLGQNKQNFLIVDKLDVGKVSYPKEQWLKASNPELFGWSNKTIAEIEKLVQGLPTDALVLIDKGIVIYSYGQVTRRFQCRSMRKSFLSALYGIHVATGDIDITKTLQELQIDDIGKLTNLEKQATIRDLLSSRSGVYHSAAYETASMRENRPKRGSHSPGTFWFYNNWNFNALLTIFEKETKEKIFQAFKQKIAQPLEMQQFRLKDTEYYYERSKSKHPAYLFEMSALDMARFGLLYMANGQWEDRQILSPEWVELSTYPHTIFNKKNPRRGYGFMWYSTDDGYYAAGKGGQRIMIIPELDVVIVHLVDNRKKGKRVKSKNLWKLLELVIKAKGKQ